MASSFYLPHLVSMMKISGLTPNGVNFYYFNLWMVANMKGHIRLLRYKDKKVLI